MTSDIPDYQTAMLPTLRSMADGREYTRPEIVKNVADFFGLTQEQRAVLLPSGKSPVIRNRVGWAVTYLKQAGLLQSVRRGIYKISERGLTVLESDPDRIDVKFLERFDEFVEFRQRSRKEDDEPTKRTPSSDATPSEALEDAYQQLRSEVEAELLETILSTSPEFFENLVVELLVAMGYGGSRRDAGRAIGQSGDGGIDGIIKEDRLGLDTIYIQAKRWQNTVGRPDIQKFAGALQGVRARKGVFITTSQFSREAAHYAGAIDTKIILIDGAELTRLMFDHNVGVSPNASYEVKQVDSDFFEDGEASI